jgi:WD40 repeat protein
MKNVYFLFIFLIASNSFSQSISLFDIDASNFPTIRGKFYAFDGAGKQQRPNISEFNIKENGSVRTITNVSCPPSQPPKAISSVLVFDVSGSMSRLNGNTTNMDLAKAAARLWVNNIPLGTSECAITSFDDLNYLNQDFTTDRTKLLNATTPLSPQGGTDYDAALIDPMAGGLLVSQKGKYQKVIIFLTDGQASDPKKQQIIEEANRQNCIIYCVTLGISTPQTLKEIVNQSRGQFFEMVTTSQEIEAIYNSILQTVQGSSPCTIEWSSGVTCQTGLTSVMLNWQNLQAISRYQPPNTSVASLEFNPKFIRFENPPIGVPVSQTISVTARNVTFNVSNISSSNPAFTINPTNFTLQPNQSQELTVTFTALDSGFSFTKMIFVDEVCEETFYANGSYKEKKPTIKSLNLTFPNGGENYILGSDSIISWEGIPETELVRLDYSTDNGNSWKYLNTTRGFTYYWKKIPRPTSNQCLVRVQHLASNSSINNDEFLTLNGHKSDVLAVDFSPDRTIIASGSWDQTVKLWDVSTGQELHTLSGHTRKVFSVAFSPDGNTIASGCYDIKLWDVKTGQELRTLSGHTTWARCLDFSTDGQILVSGSYDNTIKLWDVATGQELRTFLGHNMGVISVVFSPDGNTIASGSEDGTIKIWDVATGQILRTLTGHTKGVWSVSFSPDGGTLATGSYDGIVKLWDFNTGQEIRSLAGHTNYVLSVAFSPDGSTLASGSSDKTIKLWYVETGKETRTLRGHTNDVRSVAFSLIGNTIASGSSDKTVKLWELDIPIIQEDQSDSVFSIVEPLAQSTSIDMGDVLISRSKDSVLIDFVRNIGTWEFRVDSIYIPGADAAAFSLVSGIPKYSIEANSSHFAEFRFTPNRVGVHTAEIVIITQSDTLVQTITGIGVEPQLQIHANFIDFGEVEIGNEKVITDTLVLKNVSTSPITIDNTILMSPDIEQFEIISGGGSFTLNSGEERLVSARFKPKYGGRTSGRIGFEYNGTGSPAIAQLFGTGIGGFVYVPNDSGFAGDRKSIRLMLGNVKPEGIASLAPKFKATLRLQSNLIVPIDGSTTTIVNDSMYITVSGTIGSTSELLQIPIVVGLGTIEYTYIDIIDFRLEDNNGNPVEYNFETSSGLFTLLGVCREGGSRLVFDNAVPFLLMVTPNPSEGNVKVEVNVIEEGLSTLKIFNSTGILLEEHQFTTIGNQKMELDTKNYSNGLYFITLQTPTAFDKTKLLLVK